LPHIAASLAAEQTNNTMQTPATLLVAIADPADGAHLILERATQIAEALDATLILFHAAFDSALSGRPFFDSPRLAKSRGWMVMDRMRALERIAEPLRRRGIETEVLVSWEEPAHESIVRAAIRCDAQLVIAGEHRRGADRAPSWRLTDWELLRLCPRPLLLVRSASEPRSGPVLVALDPTHAHDKPAALDAALAAYASMFARALGVELHAVHCIPRSAHTLDADASDRRRTRERIAARLRSTLKKSRAAAKKIHVLNGEIASAVPQLAAELPAQVLVLGAISRRGLRRFAIGNTAERIIDESPCDLLIIKPPGFKPRLGRAIKQAVTLPKQ
jgi:universal stress protein E